MGGVFTKRIAIFLLVNLLVLTTIVIITSILGVGYYITGYGIDYYNLLVFAAIIGFSGALVSLLLSKWIAKSVMNVKVITPDSFQNSTEQRLLNTVYRLSSQAGIAKMPEVGIYPSQEVNAFATGPSTNSALIAVSQGLLNRLSQEEIEGVLAHEVAHVANGDMVTMTLIQGVVNTFVVFLSRALAYVVANLVRKEMAGIVHFISVIVFQICFSVLASLAVLAFSRHREFAADLQGARIAGKRKMIQALTALKNTLPTIDRDEQAAIQTFKISGQKKSGLTRLFSTHPDLDERIQRLVNEPI
ncbi:MAG: protease HtpX [Syntrophomonadaceae bacterium]|nr:protease HtpX [Syntrophomonadaceae bacterium]